MELDSLCRQFGLQIVVVTFTVDVDAELMEAEGQRVQLPPLLEDVMVHE